MASKTTIILLVVAIVAICLVVDVTSANYRKPPFNGSIFGKRAPEDSTAEKLFAMCAIATDACSQWFPASEAK
uniref:SIFamide n=1 Tax=Strigamia maritima TaxID=126957 RepID=T1IZI5_STRMM